MGTIVISEYWTLSGPRLYLIAVNQLCNPVTLRISYDPGAPPNLICGPHTKNVQKSNTGVSVDKFVRTGLCNNIFDLNLCEIVCIAYFIHFFYVFANGSIFCC